MFETGAAPVDDKSGLRSLLHAVNSASASARTGWLFLLALMAYFIVAIASVSHQDLLLNKALKLPLLGIELDLVNFFRFGPLVLLLVHFGLLVQHVMLSLKLMPLDEAFRQEEQKGGPLAKARLELHPYFYSQGLVGQDRSRVFGFFLHAMTWISFVLMPIAVLLYFQVTFLPYHDSSVTWAHRIYLIADILILLGVGVFMRKPEANFWRALWRTGRYHPFNFLSTAILVLVALLFSLFVATIPDEFLDRQMQKLAGMQKSLPHVVQSDSTRQAFILTATLFEGEVDPVTGIPKRLFHRNLIVTDKDLVPNREDKFNEVSLNLKRRDLRYARLDGTDLRRVDLAGADLSGASLVETNLTLARISCPRVQETFDSFVNETGEGCTQFVGANLTNANLTGADLRVVNLRGARLDDANLTGAKLQGAILENASFQRANFRSTAWTLSRLKGADLSWSNLQGVDLQLADLRDANIESADLRGANLSHAQLKGANLSFAKLQGANLSGAKLLNTDLSGSDLSGADMRRAVIWQTVPADQSETKLVDLRQSVIGMKKADKSDGDWSNSPEYQMWQQLKTQSENRVESEYALELSDYLSGFLCDHAWTHKAVPESLVERASLPTFAGDRGRFLQALNAESCLVRPLISEELIGKLSEGVSASER